MKKLNGYVPADVNRKTKYKKRGNMHEMYYNITYMFYVYNIRSMIMEQFYNIVKNDISLSGVQGTHRFLHISDTHASCLGAEPTDRQLELYNHSQEEWRRNRKYFAEHFGEPFNETHTAPAAEQLKKLFDYAKKEDPELLLMSGDILDYVHEAGIEYFKGLLKDYGGKYMFAPGNHDGSYTQNPVLTVFNNDSSDVAVYERDGFTVAAIDNCRKNLSDEQLGTLKKLSKGGKPVILLQHVPIVTEYNAKEMSKYEEYYLMSGQTEKENAKEYIKLVTDPESAVKCILCGHVHGYQVSEFAPGRKQICASSGLVGFVHEFTVHG